jgi:hypothetical protein
MPHPVSMNGWDWDLLSLFPLITAHAICEMMIEVSPEVIILYQDPTITN